MEKDRLKISKIISELYPSRKTYTELEKYVEEQRAEVIGWMYAYACVLLDKGEDLRKVEVPIIHEQAKVDLAV